MNGELLAFGTVLTDSQIFFGPVLHALLIESDEDTVYRFVLATLTISTR